LLRFQTSLSRGLSAIAHARACAQNDRNELPASLPTLSPALVFTAAIMRAARPVALAAGLFAGTQLGKCAKTKLGALFLTGALLGLGSFLDRFQEAFDGLREHVAASSLKQTRVWTTRSAKKILVHSSDLVPGDIVHLEEGLVPADCRVLESLSLCIDNSFLPRRGPKVHSLVPALLRVLPSNDCSCRRGHAVTEVADDENSSVLDAQCMAFATGFVTSGTGTAVVTRTGKSAAVCRLLSRLSSFSPLDVLLLPWSL
jgi:magnesium-transporting ATPase (P-type)